MIDLENVYKQYGSRTVIHDLSLSVGTDEILGFLGPNGAGKTTTIRMIAGATTATAGTVMVAGRDMATDRLAAASDVGYLPERPPLYDTLSVRQYLRFVAKAKGIARARREPETERVMSACRLEHMAAREIYKLSKGYRQRVGLAQALIGEPRVLLLDEPTIGLDPGQIQETREVIRAASAGHAVVLSTHILAEVSLLCTRVAIIHEGRLLALDAPEALDKRIAHNSVVRLRAGGQAQDIRRTLQEVDGVRSVSLDVASRGGQAHALTCVVDEREGVEAQIARIVSRGFELYALERQRPSLENIFLHYIAHQVEGDAVAPKGKS